jgi:hypothetical protein
MRLSDDESDRALSSQPKTLRASIDELVYGLRWKIPQLVQARKLEQFRKNRNKGGYQVGTFRSVKAVLGGLPETNRRRH